MCAESPPPRLRASSEITDAHTPPLPNKRLSNIAEDITMGRWRPDPTFYPSPTLAGEAPAEKLAYVALIAANGNGSRDAIGVVDTDPTSPTYGRLVGETRLPTGGNELHHFGWNACSSHLCPYAPHAHVERRY